MADIDSVLYEALPYALIAFGIVLTYRYLRLIDLTFAASFVAGPAVAGALLVNGVQFVPAIFVGLSTVILLAGFTLFLMMFLELEGLLAGLLSSFGGFAIALLFTQGTLSLHTIPTPFDILKAIDFPWVAGVAPLHPSQIAVSAILVLIAKLIIDSFLASELGLAFRAMEDDHSRSVLLPAIGLSKWRMLALGVVSGNILCGVAGTFVMLKEGQVTATRGFDALIAVLAAYLLGHVLFERRPVTGKMSLAAQAIARIAVFRSTTAALLGLLFYFILIDLLSRTDLPSSLPSLVMLVFIVAAFLVTRWPEIIGRWTAPARNSSYLVPDNDPFQGSGITIDYPGYPSPTIIVRKAAFEVPPHTTIQLTGPNGSGKSTLLKYLAGATAGTGVVLIPNVITMKRRQTAIRQPYIGYISQDAQAGSSATLTVLENLALFRAGADARAWRKWENPSKAEMHAVIASLANRAGNALAGHLSGGQRQILNLAGLIVRHNSPNVVLFDEPLTHLDEVNASAFVDLMTQMAREGRTLIIVQHDVGPNAGGLTSDARTKLARLIDQTVDLSSIQNQQLPTCPDSHNGTIPARGAEIVQ